MATQSARRQRRRAHWASLVPRLAVAMAALLRLAPAGLARPALPRNVAVRAEPQGLQAKASLDLLKAQSKAGFALRDLGERLESDHFEASALSGRVKVAYDGTQELRKVEVAADALEAAGGNRSVLEEALLSALQQAYDASCQRAKEDVWDVYRNNRQLLDAPLNQLGAGGTAQDLWANVTRSNESLRLAEELFDKFDEDKDGYWNQNETSKVQMATEGTEMQEEAFNALIIAAAPDGGRKLSEEDLKLGLSKTQVIELYTDAARQRQLGFVLDVYRDHEKVFGAEREAAASAEAAPADTSPAVN